MLRQVIRRADWTAKYQITFGEKFADAYAAALFAQGYPRGTIKHIMRYGKEFIEWGRARGLDLHTLDEDVLARFDERSARRAPSRAVRNARKCGATHLVAFLRAQGVVPAAPAAPRPLAEFEDWMLTHRGAKPSTVHHYSSLLQRKILSPFEGASVRLDARRLRQALTKVVANRSAEYATSVAVAVRAFIKFEIACGRSPAELLGAIPPMRRWKLASLPRYVSAPDVERIIAACDVTSAIGRRDRAILLLLARLALRAGDVAALTMDRIDWRAGSVRVSGKSRREHLMPLPQDVGDAILAYLRQDRPKHTTLHVFLTSRAPVRPLSSSRVGTLVADAVGRSGVDAPIRGAHLLRHSAAVRLLNREGLGLEQVAAVLRHASFDTAAIYAKVDRRLLSWAIAPWPKPARLPRVQTKAQELELNEIASPWPSAEGAR
jgi:integrase